MDKADRIRSLAHRRSDTLDASGADVADHEHSR
jgi:hypothetical protein